MGRFSPTVVADSTQRERPGKEIAGAFSTYFDEKRIETDRGNAAEDRSRILKREGQDDVVRQGDFEDYLRDRYGATPSYTDAGLGGGGFQGPGGAQETAPQPGIQGQPPIGQPSGQAPDIFQDARMGIGEPQSPLTAPPDLGPEQVVALPGQYVGGGFSPEAVTIGGPRAAPQETREFAGQNYNIDPSQTLEARTGAAQEQERNRLSAEESNQLEREIQALVEAGVPVNEARAYAMFDEEGEALERATGRAQTPPKGFDPDSPGAFSSAKEYLAFQEELATAKDAVGRRPPGAAAAGRPPIDLETAMEKVDALVGTWNPDTQSWDHNLSQGERYDLAVRMSQGDLTGEELDALASRGGEEVALPPDFESGGFKRFFQRLMPGGKSGFERMDGTEGPLEPAPEVINRPHDQPPQPGGDLTAVHDSISTAANMIQEAYPDLSFDQIKGILVEEFPEREVNQVLRGR